MRRLLTLSNPKHLSGQMHSSEVCPFLINTSIIKEATLQKILQQTFTIKHGLLLLKRWKSSYEEKWHFSRSLHIISETNEKECVTCGIDWIQCCLYADKTDSCNCFLQCISNVSPVPFFVWEHCYCVFIFTFSAGGIISSTFKWKCNDGHTSCIIPLE